ncbi:hypothetical protein PF005_g28097 [Phytophthora fragariae]|uniref:Uncharacterized protein n=1 Tax=Phytophthora fragariae TaxID=53985 RepID=A0A6A3VQ12_9STRA|nr:hypothetical protein PF005_g28097 [Phytophthora fragariae]
MNVYTLSSHVCVATSPKRKALNLQQKEYCREMANTGLRPVRIKLELSNNDKYDEIAALIREKAYTGAESDGQAFTFTWDLDEFGKPVVGNGSDTYPFLVGITTKALLRRLDRPPSTFIFHLDSTFKTNTLNYPVLVFRMLVGPFTWLHFSWFRSDWSIFMQGL